MVSFGNVKDFDGLQAHSHSTTVHARLRIALQICSLRRSPAAHHTENVMLFSLENYLDQDCSALVAAGSPAACS